MALSELYELVDLYYLILTGDISEQSYEDFGKDAFKYRARVLDAIRPTNCLYEIPFPKHGEVEWEDTFWLGEMGFHYNYNHERINDEEYYGFNADE